MKRVSFKVAKALKDAGYPQRVTSSFGWYNKEGNLFESSVDTTVEENEDECVAPTLELVAKWLRETKGCYICPIPEFYNWKDEVFNTWSMNIHWEDNIDEYKALWNTYEEALSAGIDKAIEILKNEL